MIRAMLALAVCFPLHAQDSIIDEISGESVFGVKWTDTIESVMKRYPNGEPSSLGTIRYWTVPDFRPVFGIDRRERDFIRFGFAGPTLGQVTVSFADCAVVAKTFLKYAGLRADSQILGVDTAKLGTWNSKTIWGHLQETSGNCLANIGP